MRGVMTRKFSNRGFFEAWIALTFAVISFSGCSSVGQIVKQTDGSYLIHKVDYKGIWGSMGALRADVTKEVEDFAKNQGKQVIPVGEREHPVGIAGDWAWYEVKFRLGDPKADEARLNACVEGIKKNPALQAIANKVALGGVKEQSFAMIANHEKATDSEKLAISQYADLRGKCWDLSVKTRQEAGASQAAINVGQSSKTAVDNALVALYNGSITYGDFARFRKDIYDSEVSALTKIDEEMKRNATDAAARADQLAVQNRIAQAQMWQALSSQQAANAMMIEAVKPPPTINVNTSIRLKQVF